MKHSRVQRVTALLLSWILPATTVGSPIPMAAGPGPAAVVVETWSFEAFEPEPTPEPVTAAPVAEVEPLPAPEPQSGGGGGGGTTTVSIFGPKKYVRTTGPKNEYLDTVAVPAWVVSPFTMHIQNGEADGSHRISSAWIYVNGSQAAAAPSDFNQNVFTLDRDVTLTTTTTLKVVLASKPCSYLRINLLGTNADLTAPALTIAEPAPGSTIADKTPRLLVRYQDVVGSGEPAASGVDTSTLQVLLDDVDRTALFTRRSDEASAELPEELALAEGAHHLTARVRDVAGNLGETTAEFRVDVTPPVIDVLEPAAGAYLGTRTPPIRVGYSDNLGVDLASLRVLVNGEDRTSWCQAGPAEALCTIPPEAGLPEGPNTVQGEIRDLAGNLGTSAVSFNVDTTPPSVVIAQPAEGSRHGAALVEVIVQYADEQGLDLTSFEASVDGSPVALSQGPDGAIGTVGPLPDGAHSVAARIRDRAGNESASQNAFSVDTTAPFIRVVQPPPGFVLSTNRPFVLIEYADAQGLDLPAFRLQVDGVDRTATCQVDPDAARCTLPEEAALADGPHTVAGEIRDLTGNLSSATSDFTVDTTAPQAAVEVADGAAYTGSPRPGIRFTYQDGGSGIDPASVRVFIDGMDVTASFAVGGDGAIGTPPADLPDGPHEVRGVVADRAGNAAEATAAFTVDTVPPAATFTAPANDSFTNDATPSLRLAYSDASGVDPASVRIYLRSGAAPDAPEIDVTSYFTVGSQEAVGVVPDGSPLADGTHRLRAELRDPAGNVGAAVAAFELDTVRPTYLVETPADGGFVPTSTPGFVIRYADDRSGVDTSRLVFTVDGVDRTSRLTVTATSATGALLPADALADGLHPVGVTVVDRAGNEAAPVAHRFTVDTVPPTAVVESPAPGAFVGTAQPFVRFAYSDPLPPGGATAPGYGEVDPTTVVVEIDGFVRTSEFTVAADHAQATLASPLVDGLHTARVVVLDWAGNPGEALGTFTVDTQPPSLSQVLPNDGSYLATVDESGRVQITGSVADLDPNVTITCRVGEATATATISGNQFTCSVPLTEGANSVEIIATDGTSHQTTASQTLNLDRTAPAVAIQDPAEGQVTAAFALDVRGSVVDASPVTVVVEGVPAALSGESFTAGGVPIGDGPLVPLTAVATDAAGNRGEATVTVRVDRIAPVVRIQSPAAGAYLPGPVALVSGEVVDETAVVVDVNGVAAEVTGTPPGTRTFQASVPVVDGPVTFVATAHDEAGNVGTDQRAILVDTAPPVITVTAPLPGTITNAASLLVAGRVTDASPVTLRLDGQPVPLDADGGFAMEVPLPPSDGPATFTLAATDAAGNLGQAVVSVLVDRTPPELTIASPADPVVGGVPVIVQGLVHDATATTVTVDGQTATLTGDAWQVAFPSLPEGPHTFAVTATDAAGNQTTLTRDVVVDLAAPVVVIESPADSSLTRSASVTVAGTVADRTAVTVVVNGVPATVTGSGPFSFVATGVGLAEGDNPLRAVATDATGRTGEDQVVVTRDSVPPVVDLLTPAQITRGRPGQAVATAADNLALAEVVVTVDGAEVCRVQDGFTCTAPLAVPEAAQAGTTLTVVATATDRAGNAASVTKGVLVAADGVVVGQVLSDATSLPLPGATVRMGTETVTTDEQGRYRLPTGEATAALLAEAEGMTAVSRQVPVESGVGTVPVDARLTPLAAPVVIGPDGGTLTAGALTVSVPAGAVAAETSFRLTPLSPQGLPDLLPLGFSAVAALDLRADGTVSSPFDLQVTGLPAAALHLVSYRPASHDWMVVATGLAATDGVLTVGLPSMTTGAYAVIVADVMDPPIDVPPPSEALTGVGVVALPATATGTGAVDPPVIPPTGGTAAGSVAIASPVPVPSGTVVQAVVHETYTLTTGETASAEDRRHDVLLYGVPVPEGAALAASFPITPSRSYSTTELAEGRVRLDVLSGREGVRGETGGSSPVTLEAGEARLSVPQGALAEDTAIALESVELSGFLPQTAGLTALSEVVVDLSGATLGVGAELSVVSGSVSAGDTLLVAKVERVDGVPRLTVVALGEVVDGRIVSRPYPGLPGVTKEGRYVVYRSAGPIGFVSGVTSASGSPVKAVVSTEGLPFVGLANVNGQFIVAAVTGGTVPIVATVPKTSLVGSAIASVAAGETTTQNVLLSGAVTTATVEPPDGTLGASPTLQVEVTTSAPVNPATVIPANVALTKVDDGATVPVRLVLSGSGKLLAVIPQQALAFSTDYRFAASGLADIFGGAVAVPAVTFRTKDFVAPVYDPKKLSFSFPDSSGIVHLTAPAGTLPPGAKLLVINAGNGVVASFTADNDGAVGVLVPAELPASISDRLLITIEDPQGNVTTFEKSEFTDPATGRTAVGPGGGTVVAADGSGAELRIPVGATDKGVVLRIESFQLEDLPEDQRQTPDFPGATFGSGLKIESPDTPAFKKEIKLAFPLPSGLPENPSDAFFYVVRRIEGPPGADGSPIISFETIDQAVIEGEGDAARVVTASYPFGGYTTSFGSLSFTGGQLGVAAVATSYNLLMWTHDQLVPGKPTVGVITGKVLRQKWNPGAAVPEYEPVEGAWVSGTDEQGNPLLVASPPGVPPNTARSQKDGTFTLWDSRYAGGTVQLAALIPGSAERRTATAFEADPLIGDTYPLLRPYRNRATVNITFPAVEHPPPPPLLQIRVFRLDSGQRVDTSGLAVANQALVVGFSVKNGEVRGATINGREYGVRVDPLFGSPTGMDRILDPEFTPAQPGSYTVTATAIAAFGPPITQSLTFRVVAEGGSNNDPLQDDPPAVITARTVPKKDATGVPVTVFPQVVFTEPVRNVPGNVTLVEAGGTTPVALKISGVGPSGPIEDLTMNPAAVVTSLTLQPMVGLKYGTKYTLTLTEGIQDLDTDGAGNPAPKSLVPVSTSFTTFGPSAITEPGTGETFGSTGIVVLGHRAFLVENRFSAGVLRVFDVTDPAQPVEMDDGCCDGMYGRPVDIAGEEGTVVVAMSSPARSTPSSLYVFDVSNERKTEWVGVSSVTGSVSEGFINRIQVKDERVYVATGKKGIQVVDVAKAREVFKPCCGTDYWRMLRDLATDGVGFGREAVVGEVEVKRPPRGPGDPPQPSMLYDLEVGDFALDGQPARLVVSTGFMTPLVIVDPQAMNVVWQGTLVAPDGSAEMTTGQAVGLGRVTDRDIAVVTGSGLMAGASKPLLATVSLQDPANPEVLGFLDLSLAPCLVTGDVLVKDTTAYVSGGDPNHAGCVLLVSLDGPRPTLAGMIPGIGGRLALGEDGILYASGYSQFGQAGPLGGVRTAALGYLAVITVVKENPVVLAADRKSVEPQALKYRVFFPREEIESSELEVLRGSTPIKTVTVQLDGEGKGETTLAPGLDYSPDSTLTARVVVNRGKPESERPRPAEKVLLGERFEVEPTEAQTLEVGERIDVAAVNAALQERLAKDPDVETPALRWEGPGFLWPPEPAPPGGRREPTGVWDTELRAEGPKGSTSRMRLFQGSTLMAESGAISFDAGAPALLDPQSPTPQPNGRFVVTPPPTAPPAQPGLVVIPADGQSRVQLKLEDVKDIAGNLVPDGTPVDWSLEGEDGELLNAEESVLVNGSATVEYQAGEEPGDVFVLAVPGTGELQPVRMLTIRQAQLMIEIPPSVPVGAPIVATVTSAGGPPKDGTPAYWWTGRGSILGETEVRGGEVRANWTPLGIPSRPVMPVPPRVPVFVNVARARGDTRVDRTSSIPLELPRIRFNRDRVLVNGPVGGVGPFHSEATAQITDGPPNGTMRLVLGTTRLPAVEPVAAFAFDDNADGLTADGYGGPGASVAPGVSLDTSDLERQPASFHFDGSGGVTLAGPALTQEFGFSLWARFDSLAPGQKLVEKAGSYSLELVEVAGQGHLALRVTTGGEVREVVSRQALDAGVWYHVAAEVRNRELALAVAGDDTVELGAGVVSVDASEAPVVVGGTLRGNLDELAVYDFTRFPLMVFSNGLTEIDVAFDVEGKAEVEVWGAGKFFSAGGGGQAPPDDMQVMPMGFFGDRLRQVPIRWYQAPEPTLPRPESFLDHLGAAFRETTQQCVDGIGSGESEDAAGVGCDLSIGLLPGVGTIQDFRDFYFAARNFTKGKQTTGDYVKGVFALAGLAILTITQAKRIKGLFDKAKTALFGVSAEVRLARELERKLSRAVAEGALDSESLVVRTVADEFGDAETKQAVKALVGVCDSGPCGSISAKAQDLIDDVAARYADDGAKDAFLKGLGKAYLRTGPKEIEKLLRAMKQAPTMRLSAEAIEGLAVFVKSVPGKKRVRKLWDELMNFHGLTLDQANDAAEKMFKNLRAMDDRLFFATLTMPADQAAKLRAGWRNFINRGAGTSRRRSSTRGFSHHLEQALKETPEKIRAIDSEFPGYPGRPDLLVEGPEGIIQKEFKAIGANGRLTGNDLAQLKRNIKAAKERAKVLETSLGITRDEALRRELRRIVYVFRGSVVREDLKRQILETAKKALRGRDPSLAQELFNAIKFEGNLPF